MATVHEIQSVEHPLVKEIHRAMSRGEKLTRGAYAGTLFIDSPHLLEEAAQSGVEICAVLFCEWPASMPESQAELYRVSAAAFKKMASTESPQGLVALVRPRVWLAHELFEPAPALVLILAGIQDPGNAGTLLRSGEAFGATGALLLRGTVHATNPKLLRGAAGSTFRLPHMSGVQLDQALAMCAANSAKVYALDPRAALSLDEVDLAAPCALAIGAEGAGLPPALLDAATAVAIPRARRVESLNAATAGSIALYEVARQRVASPRDTALQPHETPQRETPRKTLPPRDATGPAGSHS